MEQTPVEWLVEELTLNESPKWVQDAVEQAKEMEKERLESLKDFDTWKEWKNSQ